ncbi:16S rRNA (cytosine(967)-C(5))-methyltransferase RsmB [Shouchella shacheensis]|uniref:16S rRNA (cytosine(967)-C(5))-methyltransferase RsmB n=1 Tax=Shouchella shacheensis TaxID=1649580 RepID=UPI0009EC3E5A|nr:16S rRNA (cytosine(967)-C(5))-methyltransferase RsmB [Shouchella shacheensis]
MSKPTVREVALDALLKVEKNQAYSHLLLNDTLKKSGLDRRDAGLLTELVYGTIARRLTLDFYLQPFLKKPRKLDAWVRVLLHLSVYQMVYLDRVPDRAVVHEAVTIAKKRGHQGISGFVNGVLRQVQRKGLPNIEEIADPLEAASIQTSHPRWLLASWKEQYGLETAIAMASANNVPPDVTLRVNTSKADVREVIEGLGNEGIEVRRGSVAKEALVVEKGNVFKTNAFAEGLFTAQDESSMLVAGVLAPQPGMRVLDACAAPGGKTTHLAELMNGEGNVQAYDLHKHKVKLINEQVERLGLANVTAQALDARKLSEEEISPADRVLVDAPCSGFGVIRRKPDMKWTKSEADVRAIASIQLEILKSASTTVKSGGLLVYSTCTVDKTENEQIVRTFLGNHPEFQVDPTMKQRLPETVQEKGRFNDYGLTILPHDFATDGFFITCMRKAEAGRPEARILEGLPQKSRFWISGQD